MMSQQTEKDNDDTLKMRPLRDQSEENSQTERKTVTPLKITTRERTPEIGPCTPKNWILDIA